MNNEVSTIIIEHARRLAARPGMFLGNDISMANIAHFMEGYFQALFDTKQISQRNLWQDWLNNKYRLWGAEWTWEKILLSKFASEEEAINALPKIILNP